MTQEEILEYNKRCAEFLGANIQNVLERIYIDKMKDNEMIFHNTSVDSNSYEWDGEKNIHYIPFNMLQFHSDWNWIHEIFEKINTSIITAHMNGIPDSIVPYLEAKNPIIISLLKNNKKAVVQAIYQFLKWYNNEQIQTN